MLNSVNTVSFQIIIHVLTIGDY